ncbi:DUF6543 domain-containing protein, partial [Pseudomonas gingeri]|uniref:DUF6543 domain-containing protein n=1 Tax=Pseudomonas gingeri TaxID=117681 RepID=UPI00159F98D5
EAGWSHIGDVMATLARLAVGGAAFHVTVSPFIEGLKSITLPSGEVRLWKPDIQAYALEVQRPTTAVPDEAGLRRVQETHVLDLDGKRYALQADTYPGQSRI